MSAINISSDSNSYYTSNDEFILTFPVPVPVLPASAAILIPVPVRIPNPISN